MDDILGLTLDNEDVDQPAPVYSITSYGADYTVDSLVKRLDNQDVYIPEFQRSYVWKLPQASRFIESLLLGLPVPGIFLSKESVTQKLLVIDGQQRLKSLQYFYRGIFEPTKKEFALVNVQPQFKDKTYRSLSEEDRRKLDNAIIHATIIKQDEPTDDESSVYHIFERLNTTGSLLTPQEIRACIFHGKFNELLDSLNNNSDWRCLYGAAISTRQRDKELLLRFFALNFNKTAYKSPMKQFLNTFMGKNRDLQMVSVEAMSTIFTSTVKILNEVIGEQVFRPQKTINAAAFDSIMVGVARRLEKGEITQPDRFREEHKKLINNSDYIDSITTGTSQEKNVQQRIEIATRAFSDVK